MYLCANILRDCFFRSSFLKRHNSSLGYEPRPKGRGMIWEEFRDPPKFGCEIPGPEGPGFWRPDKTNILINLTLSTILNLDK
jgi:hypothetical protein